MTTSNPPKNPEINPMGLGTPWADYFPNIHQKTPGINPMEPGAPWIDAYL